MVDRPAAQRMIMHSIPKNQIVPNPGVSGNESAQSVGSSSLKSKGAGQKRVVQEISSDESSVEQSEVYPAKKTKSKKGSFKPESN